MYHFILKVCHQEIADYNYKSLATLNQHEWFWSKVTNFSLHTKSYLSHIFWNNFIINSNWRSQPINLSPICFNEIVHIFIVSVDHTEFLMWMIDPRTNFQYFFFSDQIKCENSLKLFRIKSLIISYHDISTAQTKYNMEKFKKNINNWHSLRHFQNTLCVHCKSYKLFPASYNLVRSRITMILLLKLEFWIDGAYFKTQKLFAASIMHIVFKKHLWCY